MKNILLTPILFLCFFCRSAGQGIDNESISVTHGPYIQNLGAGGVTIIWTTSKPAIPGVQITSPDGVKRFVRNSRDGNIDGGGTLHKVRIEDLSPATAYKYEIISVQVLKYQAYSVYYGDTLKGKAEGFVTYPLMAEKVKFCVINDVHGNSGKMASYLKKGRSSENNLYFFNGDMVEFLQETDQLFPDFIDTAVTYFGRQKPFYYVRGNHETRGYKARELRNYFDYKDGRFFYSFDYGPVHFTVLDCGEDKPDNNRYYYGLADYDTYRMEELEWLKKDIKSESFRNAKQRILIVHMPVIKEERQGWGMKFLSDHFGPLLKNSGIDLMISAHTHRNSFYEKTNSGFDYPVLVNSNNSFVEVDAGTTGIKATVKDVNGKTLASYNIE